MSHQNDESLDLADSESVSEQYQEESKVAKPSKPVSRAKTPVKAKAKAVAAAASNAASGKKKKRVVASDDDQEEEKKAAPRTRSRPAAEK